MNPTNVQGVIRSRRESAIVCHEVFYDSGTTLDRHTHRTAVIAWLMSGAYTEIACGSEFACVPRSTVYHPMLAEHAVRIEAMTRCFVIEFDPREMHDRYAVEIPNALLHLEGGPLASVLSTLYGEFRSTDDCSSLAIQGLMLQVLAGLRRRETREIGRPSWLDRIDEMLRADFRSRLSLEDFAAAVGQSPERVSCVFRRFYHRSIAEEQRRLRIEFACERLRDPDASLAEIALDAGFSDQPHFSRAFKEITGLTPARYRMQADALQDSGFVDAESSGVRV
ncbi:MAG TPA: AraC family transcriptional regulator [Thermoanaerobaculia bacterium]|nr:AraC family transcriptional regulator [Thermoanaerobaculia bacterium]